MDNIEISVVIPTKNGQKYLDAVLKGVFSQKINAKFEVIVVDSGSTDKTLDIIAGYLIRLYRIDENEFNHGLTRNLGISKSKGKYIILITQDAIPYDCRWMEKLVNNLEYDERVAGAYSMQIPHKDARIMTQMRVNRFFTASKIKRVSQIDRMEDYRNLTLRQKHLFCSFDNVSSCIRKTVWGKIPFPKTDFGEDIEWSKEVLERGYKIVYEPDSKVYHSHDLSIYDWYKRNLINFDKLSALFGITTVDSFTGY